MTEREIVGGEEEFGFKQIKCMHCDGTGKCGCYDCVADKIKYRDYDTTKPIGVKSYNELLKEKPDFKIDCQKCNGYGFLLLDKNGKIRKPQEG